MTEVSFEEDIDCPITIFDHEPFLFFMLKNSQIFEREILEGINHVNYRSRVRLIGEILGEEKDWDRSWKECLIYLRVR